MSSPNPTTLRDNAAALRHEAHVQRETLNDRYEKERTDLGIGRDRAARDEYAAEQAAKSADLQVKHEFKEKAKFEKEAADFNKKADAADRSGDSVQAEEMREIALGKQRAVSAADARAEAAERDAADLKVKQAEHHREVVDAEQQLGNLSDLSYKTENEIDLFEDQARLLDDAATRLRRADTLESENNPKNAKEIAKLRDEADGLVDKAQKFEIDTEAIGTATGRTVVVPDISGTPVSSTEPEPETAPDPATDTGTAVAMSDTGTDLDLVGDSTPPAAPADGETEPEPTSPPAVEAATTGAGDTFAESMLTAEIQSFDTATDALMVEPTPEPEEPVVGLADDNISDTGDPSAVDDLSDQSLA